MERRWNGTEFCTICRVLLQETELLTVEEHLRLLSCQYLARALQPHHVNHADVTAPSGPRQMKETLQSKCLPFIEQFVGASGTVAPADYRRILGEIHTKMANDSIDSTLPNRVLGCAPPRVSPEETALPRLTRVTLSRLRSGFCSSLASFNHRIGASPTDTCPECQSAPHTTNHLFACAAHPTSLAPSDLWEKPWESAEFLRSLPQFSSLPDPGSRPPPRPGERRRPPRAPPRRQFFIAATVQLVKYYYR